MPVLPIADRKELWAEFMRALSREHSPTALSKGDLRDTIDAADAWAETNAASYNAALPPAARAGLTVKQKAWVLTLVIRRRYEVT